MSISFEIQAHIGTIRQGTKRYPWSKEINLVSWNEGKPKIDIREWDEAHKKMKKGLTLEIEEFEKVFQIASSYFKKENGELNNGK